MAVTDIFVNIGNALWDDRPKTTVEFPRLSEFFSVARLWLQDCDDRLEGFPRERNKNLLDVPTHLRGGGGGLEVFTGTDSDCGGHTGLLFCGGAGGGGRVIRGQKWRSTFTQNMSERRPSVSQTAGIHRGVSVIRVEQGGGTTVNTLEADWMRNLAVTLGVSQTSSQLSNIFANQDL